MSRILLLLLLASGSAGAQEPETGTSAPSEAALGLEETAEAAPLDPVAAWEADGTLLLDAAEVELEAFEYLARPLVVFADSPRQPQFIEQMRLIEREAEELARRDVAVIVDTDPESRSAVRSELRPRGFGVVLVDKDGRVTLRRPAPLSVREIARAIDRTPIRQEELREGRGAASSE